MAIKRITASSMSQGLKVVSQQFGDQAVILSSRKVERGVEIMIEVEQEVASPLTPGVARATTSDAIIKANPLPESLDSQEIASWLSRLQISGLPSKQSSAGQPSRVTPPKPAVRSAPNAVSHAVAAPRVLVDDVVPSRTVAPSTPDPWQALAELQASMAELKASVMQQSAAGLTQPPAAVNKVAVATEAPPADAAAAKQQGQVLLQLSQYGFTTDYIHSAFAGEGGCNQRMTAWMPSLPTLKHQPSDAEALLFVGPTGAGKTTSLAKLLTLWVLDHGASGVAVLSMDQYRMGSMDSLKTLCTLLNVPFVPVTADQPLSLCLAQCRGKKLFIDSSGCQEGLAFVREQLLAADALVYQLLCLPASHQFGLLRNYCQQLKKTLGQADALLLTKVDENPAIGHLLQLSAQLSLPLAYWSAGNKIPDDIEKIRLNSLITKTWRQTMQLHGSQVRAA